VTGAAPLGALRSGEMPPGAWTPLLATRGRQGTPQPIAAGAEAGGRRWVVALGSGYWNWAFRGGTERQIYERLWGAIAGWLTRERGTATLAAVRPARMAWPRGLSVPWLAPGLAPDSLNIELTSETGDVVQDTTITRTAIDTAFAAAPVPGHYSYRARAFSGDTIIEAEGLLTIERYSPELARPGGPVVARDAAGTLVRTADDGDRRGTPLHATAYPYLLVLLLLAAEWILRRRWGLR
jgi:hypothetical protein